MPLEQGWDALREHTRERQKELGVVPPDTELTARPDVFPAWDSLTDTQKKLYVRSPICSIASSCA